MDFDWKWQDSLDDLPPDQLGRGEYAKFLTEFLNSKATQSYVMNLNAEWGAGKTYFLKRWFNEVKKRHPAAYIDAWKNDFSEDPLLTVITEITEALKSNRNVAAENYRGDLFRSGGRLLKQAGPAFFKGILKTYAGVDSEDFDAESFSDAAEKALTLGVEEHKNKLIELENFKTSIKRWLQDCFEHGQKQPMYVFIDELDRCRPTYAIELLETVKHLFDIEGVVFVIATDTDQLQHSIKVVYGSEFEALKYLQRFFNRTYKLRVQAPNKYIEFSGPYQATLKSSLRENGGGLVKTSEEDIVTNLSSIVDFFGFDLRTTDQWLDKLSSICNGEKSNSNYLWPIVAVLSAMQIKDESLFAQIFPRSGEKHSLSVDSINTIMGCWGNYESKVKVNFRPVTFKQIPINGRHDRTRPNPYQETGLDTEIKIADLVYGINNGFVGLNREHTVRDSRDSLIRNSKADVKMLPLVIDENCRVGDMSLDKYLNLVEMASDLT